tara:strand:+ start:4246 stop:5319 length:1074 start_codon:yes stop_codon:yes gene_type:complete
MKVCILGNGLTSLALAKTLVNQGLYVDVFYNEKIKNFSKSSTIGLTKANIDFFNKNILNIKKNLWKINKIDIISHNLKKEKIINFENDNEFLFSMVENDKLYKSLMYSLKKDKLFKLKKINNYKSYFYKNYRLVFNCDSRNSLSKKFFSNSINKNYKSYAYTTIIEHKKILKNNIATQIFTKFGPLAFLPISNKRTSLVYSVKGSLEPDFENLIKKFYTKYSITKINEISKFKLKSSNLRNYRYKNILAFGDLLHRVHPLAGQGFNMSIRDIKLILELIEFKMERGLELDSSIFYDFEKKIKHKNFIFSKGIDFIYEFFNLESKFNNSVLSKSVQQIGKNKFINNFFAKVANRGIEI